MGLFRKKTEIVKDYDSKLKKSRVSFKDKLKALFSKKIEVDEEFFESLEDLLISSDVGAKLSINLVNETKKYCKENKVSSQEQIVDILFEKIKSLYNSKTYNSTIEIDEKPKVILLFGVNGVGKTTSIAKLANNYLSIGKKVLLVAADTFRAGAVEQLQVWANRINCDIVVGKENSDPSSVIYDGVSKAYKEGYDICLVDTAGRLQSKQNLMDEASKMYRVINKVIPEANPESLLVLDATIGQNGVFQARAFLESVKINGIILTKMDGISKGGIILSIKEELNIPVKYIGLGETINDLYEFDIDSYLNGLLKGE